MKIFLSILSLHIFPLINVGSQLCQHVNYWGMEGKRISHVINDSTDLFSETEIIELQDTNGISSWFARKFNKTVCYTGVCQMMLVWIFWDGVGNYLGFHFDTGEFLTKIDHTQFTDQDYKTLHLLLKDTASIIKNMEHTELVTVSAEKDEYLVDGYTGATLPLLKEVVVKDAVFTCYELWHTVYGITQQKIDSIVKQKIDGNYLNQLLKNTNPDYIKWAILYVAENNVLQDDFNMVILNKINSNKKEISKIAFEYFHSDRLRSLQLQNALIGEFPNWDENKRTDLLWWLYEINETENIDDTIIIQLLKLFKNEIISIGSLHLIYQLINEDQITTNNEISTLLFDISLSNNLYISNLTKKILHQFKELNLERK